MLDWWFDIDNRICCAHMDERKTASSMEFEGDVRLRFDDVKILRSGLTYVYRTPDNHSVSINDVKFRGERYVSLYCDGRLIKEYNVRAERLKDIYFKRPEIYDRVSRFIGSTIVNCAAAALFCSPVAVAAMSVFSMFSSLSSVLWAFVAFVVLFFLFFAGIRLCRYIPLHTQMEKYSIISSVKKPKKRKRKKTGVRRMRRN